MFQFNALLQNNQRFVILGFLKPLRNISCYSWTPRRYPLNSVLITFCLNTLIYHSRFSLLFLRDSWLSLFLYFWLFKAKLFSLILCAPRLLVLARSNRIIICSICFIRRARAFVAFQSHSRILDFWFQSEYHPKTSLTTLCIDIFGCIHAQRPFRPSHWWLACSRCFNLRTSWDLISSFISSDSLSILNYNERFVVHFSASFWFKNMLATSLSSYHASERRRSLLFSWYPASYSGTHDFIHSNFISCHGALILLYATWISTCFLSNDSERFWWDAVLN